MNRAIELIAECHFRGIRISRGSRPGLISLEPIERVTPDLIARARELKPALLEIFDRDAYCDEGGPTEAGSQRAAPNEVTVGLQLQRVVDDIELVTGGQSLEVVGRVRDLIEQLRPAIDRLLATSGPAAGLAGARELQRHAEDLIARRGRDYSAQLHDDEPREPAHNDKRDHKDEAAVAEVRRIEHLASSLGWTAERLNGAEFWPIEKRGLAAVLSRGDRIIRVTTDFVEIEHLQGSHSRFWRFNA